jgi:stearoyl-CoA desaturase (delta-9 desaturase)
MFSGSPKNIFVVSQFMIITGLFGLGYLFWTQQYAFVAIGFFLGWVFLQISYQIALHRYFSHRSFKTSKFWHVVLCFSTVLAGITPRYYEPVHPLHHAFSDTNKDPHGPILGFWKVFSIHIWNPNRSPSSAIYGDYWIQFTIKWYFLILLLFYSLLVLIDMNLLFSYGIAIVFTKLSGLLINYTAHVKNFPGNYRNFEIKDHSCNNLFTGIVLGEWHNNHHCRPQDWNQRVKWWELDIPAIVIRVIKQ